MNRRNFLIAGGGLAAGASLPWLMAGTNQVSADVNVSISDLQSNWQELVPGNADLPTLSTPLQVSRAEWKERLPADAFHVLFKEGTERPGSSPLDNEKNDGIFTCAACDLPLFTSAMKYNSGTGWPSFFTSIATHLETSTDFKLILPRTEYHCARCGGHQGHIFDDGPAPTQERWCNNGVALKFRPADDASVSMTG